MAKSISRIDSKKCNLYGWYVRVVFKGEIYSQFFNDNKYGYDRGREEAIRWRNNTEKSLGKPRTDRMVIMDIKNPLGVAGIEEKTICQTKNDKTYYWPVFIITWSVFPNKLSRTSVSIKKWGREEALSQAIQIRKSKEREIYGHEL